MLKTVMLVSALALCAPAFAQDQMSAGQEPTTTAPAKPAKKAKTDKSTPMTEAQTPASQDTPTTAAQDAPTSAMPAADPAVPAEQAMMPAPQTTPAAPTAPAQTVATTPMAPSTPADPAAVTPTETAAVSADPATPVTGATQIAQVVNTEFPTYDKNADTNLDKTEFGAWMVALKTASDPTTKAGDPATVKWVDGAFASADADKSAMVSKDELTKYLSQGAE